MLTLAKLVLKFESANTSCASVTRLMSQLKQDYIAKMESSRQSPYKNSSVLSPGPETEMSASEEWHIGPHMCMGTNRYMCTVLYHGCRRQENTFEFSCVMKRPFLASCMS